MSKIFGVHIPADFKNLAINGGMDLFQRFAGAAQTVNTATTSNAYIGPDMFATLSAGSTVKNYSVASSANVPSLAQSGFNSTNSAIYTHVTAIPSFAATDYVVPFEYRMEGLDYEKIHTKTINFGFWVNASVLGTYSFALANNALTRCYTTTFAIASVGWQYVTVPVTLDQTGTWLFSNGVGLRVQIGAVAGSTFASPSNGVWQAGNYYAAVGATNWMATSGATLLVTQFSMLEGALGLGAQGFARQGKSLGHELALAQRYCLQVPISGVSLQRVANANIGNADVLFQYPVDMRATPTYNAPTWTLVNSGTPTVSGINTRSVLFFAGQTVANSFSSYSNSTAFTIDAGL